ncbi:MAG: family 78 glycoside hydrolase catalytic domain [Caulobacterales bacterium]
MPDQVRVVGLRAVCLDDPLGLEIQRPRLSWRLESDRRGARQSAYRVLVAADPDALARGEGGLWDSRKIVSDRSFDIAYEGPPLSSRQLCFWTVQVWDETDAPAAAPANARWEMGLQDPADWTAQWLAVETDEDRADREAGLKWIWSEGPPEAPTRRFRYRFHLTQPAKTATLTAAARDQVTALWLDGQPLKVPAANPHAFGPGGALRLELGDLAAGDHCLAAEVTVARRGGDPRPPRGAFAALLTLNLDDGEAERLVTGPDWKASADDDPDWAAPSFDDAGWPAAGPAQTNPGQPWPPTQAMRLRTHFDVAKPIKRARLYATALGAYEAFVNGTRVGDALLAPESTDFRKRALYRAYDVTDLIQAGANVLAAHAGDGWYASVVAPGGRYAFGPAPRRFLAQLELTFADGPRQIVQTDPQWRTAPSPAVRSEIYNGETWDARLDQVGWNRPGFDVSVWRPARLAEAPPSQLAAHAGPPIRVTETLKAKTVAEPRPGVFLYDFGQNFAGICRLRVKGQPGDRVQLRFAEILGPDGEVDQSNLRAAAATDVYILGGDEAGEVFQPSFTYHGFRYVQVEGYPGRPTLADLDGLVIHSDLPLTGALRIDNPLVQQLWRNALWSQRSNFTGIPTDCPQRDERLGWLGDANVFWDAAAFNMDVYAFTQRFADDMRDAQAPGGGFSDYAPAARRFGDEPAPGWADAGVVLPWTAWRRYGATSIIDQNWAAMERYLGYIEDANPNHLWQNKRGLDFGDWLALDAKRPGDPTTPKDLIGTAWWAYTTELAAEMAHATGRAAESARLTALHGRIVAAFQGAHIDEGGSIGNGSQTGYILALKFGLVPHALRAVAAKRLTDEIEGRGGVLSTGFLGTPFSLDVLADIGRPDLVYDLLLRTEFPSWGYMIAKGATTIWERWNGDVGDVAMNSFNHYALGAVAGFLFRRIAGIDAAAPGFKEIVVRPVLDPRLRRAGGDYDSVLGRISTDWDWTPGELFRLSLTVPANASAQVVLPTALGDDVWVDGGRLAPADPARGVAAGGETSVRLGAGSFELSVRP